MSNTPELHLQPCIPLQPCGLLQSQSVDLTSLLGSASSNTFDPMGSASSNTFDPMGSASSNTFDPMGTLPPALVSELKALKGGDPNTEITLTIYRGRCKMEVYF